MAKIFSIKVPRTDVTLDPTGKGVVAFSVTNTSTSPQKGQAVVRPDKPGIDAWFSVADAVRDYAVGVSTEIKVRLAVPPDAPAGAYQFALDLVREGPEPLEERTDQGPGVSFGVTGGRPRWLLWAIIGGAVALVAIIALVIILSNQKVTVPDISGNDLSQASTALAKAGLVPGSISTASSDSVAQGLALGSTPGAKTSVPPKSTVDLVFSGGKPPTPPTPPTLTPTTPPVVVAPNPNQLKPGTVIRLTQIKMFDPQKGWALGQSTANNAQHVLFTSDGGVTWADRTPAQAVIATPAGAMIADAFFSSTSQAWVIYGGTAGQGTTELIYVFRTSDGGSTWTRSQPLALADVAMDFSNPSDLGFLDNRQGWVMVHLGAGMSHDYFAAFTTADGGNTWKRVLAPSTPYPLMGCYKTGLVFSGPAEAWLSGSCPGLMPVLFLYHSSNGGVDWTPITLPDPAGQPAGYLSGSSSAACGITALLASSARPLSLIVQCTNFSDNTSQSWLYTASTGSWIDRAMPVPYLNLSLLPSGEIFLVGSEESDPTFGGAVFYSSDGGSTWIRTAPTTWTGSPDFIDASHGWVIVQGNQPINLARSDDGGRSWAEIRPIIGP